jgi:hypothetical protein
MGGGGNELGGDFGALDDGMRLLKRAQTLVPMFFKRNMAAVKVLAALTFVALLVEVLFLGLIMIMSIAELYSLLSLTPFLGGALGFVLVLTLQVMGAAALRAGRLNMFEAPGTASTLGGAFGAMTPGLVGAAVGTIALFLGGSLAVCCVLPGLIAYAVLCWAPWLMAARGEPIGDGFSTSIELGQKYWAAGAGLVVAQAIFFGVIYSLIGSFGGTTVGVIASRAVMGAIADPTGMIIASTLVTSIFVAFKWVCFAVALIAMYAATGGVMSAMEEEYFGEVIAV